LVNLALIGWKNLTLVISSFYSWISHNIITLVIKTFLILKNINAPFFTERLKCPFILLLFKIVILFIYWPFLRVISHYRTIFLTFRYYFIYRYSFFFFLHIILSLFSFLLFFCHFLHIIACIGLSFNISRNLTSVRRLYFLNARFIIGKKCLFTLFYIFFLLKLNLLKKLFFFILYYFILPLLIIFCPFNHYMLISSKTFCF